MELMILTGLSGAGKSQAMNSLEDIGYYCIDNLPPALMSDFLKLLSREDNKINRAAFVIDIRGGEFFDDLMQGLDELDEEGIKYKILFLEADDKVLIRRYKETRRTHPLSGSGTLMESIAKEREKLYAIRKRADNVIDTSRMKTAELKSRIQEILKESGQAFQITVLSFGFKHGMPLDADFVFDLRFIPNPFYVEELRELTGNDREVQDYVMKHEEAGKFLNRVYEMISDLIEGYKREGKLDLVVAFACTGGRHRSVTLANKLSEMMEKAGRNVKTLHRDVDR